MFPSVIIILYIVFLVLISIRKHNLRKERELEENRINIIPSLNNTEFMIRKSYDNYDSFALMNHNIII